MNFLESDLEKIMMNSQKELLFEKGLWCFDHYLIKNQVQLGNYGRADILAYNRPLMDYDYNGKIVQMEKAKFYVYELKKDEITVSSFFQAVRYAKGLMRYLLYIKGINSYSYDVKIILIGKKVPSSDVIYLPDLTEHSNFSVEIYKYDFDINGLNFERLNNYNLVKEGLDR